MIIAIEGVDAVGKATQAKLLVKHLREEQHITSIIEFPDYTTEVGEVIKGFLKKWWDIEFNEECENVSERKLKGYVLQALMTLNRYELVDTLKEWRDQGVLVLDRYWVSALAYGEATGLSREFLTKIHSCLPQPDLWLFLDIPMEESFKRRPLRRDRHETDLDLLQKARDIYLDVFKRNGWPIINGLGSKEEVHNLIWEQVAKKL
jgi:dTMP kinase